MKKFMGWVMVLAVGAFVMGGVSGCSEEKKTEVKKTETKTETKTEPKKEGDK